MPFYVHVGTLQLVTIHCIPRGADINRDIIKNMSLDLAFSYCVVCPQTLSQCQHPEYFYYLKESSLSKSMHRESKINVPHGIKATLNNKTQNSIGICINSKSSIVLFDVNWYVTCIHLQFTHKFT